MRHQVAAGGSEVAADTRYSIVDKGHWQDLSQTISMIPHPAHRRTHSTLYLLVPLLLFAGRLHAKDLQIDIPMPTIAGVVDEQNGNSSGP